MLDLLVKYAHDHGLEAEPGFKPKEVRWAIFCDTDGRFLDVIELGDTSQKRNPGQTFPKCPEMDRGALQAGGKSHFLVETADVVALLSEKDDATDKQKKHEYFVSLLRDAGEVMPQLTHVANTLSDEASLQNLRESMERQKVKPTDKVTFKVGEVYPIESDVWHDWWRSFRKELGGNQPDKKVEAEAALPPMRCFVTGELVQPIATHLKIEKLADVGGQPSGDALICFDKEAFRSYHLEQSANAAVSEQSMSAYRAALNTLLKEKGQRLTGAKVIHWFKGKVPPTDDPLPWLEEGTEQQELDAQHRAQKLLQSLRNGERPDLADNYFYALTLSGAAGRVMVRDWMEGQFEELLDNISKWFEDFSIVHRDGGTFAHSPKFLAVLGSTVRDLKNLPSPFVTKMWRVAVCNEPIPQSALAQALGRARVGILQDEPPNHARMGLMKAYHIRKNRGGDRLSQDLKPYLNEDHPDPAYQCGRLMAMLAKLQHAALGDVGAGVVQRYYAAASSTPSLVLGRLTRTSQFHLNKLEPGLAYWYEGKIANIWSCLGDAIPRTLSLEEQSLFALGYYQQIADLRPKKSDSADQKKEDNNE